MKYKASRSVGFSASRAFAWTLLGLVGTVACSAESGDSEAVDSATEELSVAGGGDQPECGMDADVPGVEISADVDGDALEVTLANRLAEPASVVLDSRVVSAAQLAQRSGVRRVSVPANGARVLRISLASLGVADLRSAADVIVAAQVSYASGERSGNSVKVSVGPAPVQSPAALAAGAAGAPPGALDGTSAAHLAVKASSGGVGVLAAVNKTLCFNVTMSLVQSGIGEDYWTNNSWIAPARGQTIWGQDPTGAWRELKLDLGNGCITGSFETGSWTFRAYSNGFLGSMPIELRRESDDSLLYTQFTASVSSSTGTQTLTYTATSATTAFTIVHASLLANAGALTSLTLGKTLPVKIYASATNASVNGVNISTNDMNNKWVTAHELGHYVMRNEANTSSSDFNLTGVACAAASHTALSREFNSAASNEGFASFYSATVWNAVAQNSCITHFSSHVIDCENTSTDLPNKKMETDCTDANSQAGHGNETDWQRTYWDLVDPSGATQQATMREVLDFLDRGTGFTSTNYYTVLNTASDHASTPDYLETRWDSFAPFNGIDH